MEYVVCGLLIFYGFLHYLDMLALRDLNRRNISLENRFQRFIGCKVIGYSSRICEYGTKCCTVYHNRPIKKD